MKNNLILIGLFISITSVSYAQEITPFAWKQKKGISITKKVLPELLDRTWTTYRHYQVQNDTATAQPGQFIAFNFNEKGEFQGAAGKNRLNGTWTLKDKRTLVLNRKDSITSKEELITSGDYLIYKLNAEELVMALTKQGEQKVQMILYCKGTKSSVLAEPYKPTTTQAVKADAKEVDAARDKREKAALIQEITTEAMLRDVKLKEKLEQTDLKMLQVLRRRILFGMYEKDAIRG